jgi:hypothetical protein
MVFQKKGYIYTLPYPYPLGSEKEGRAQHWLEVSTEYSKTYFTPVKVGFSFSGESGKSGECQLGILAKWTWQQ